MSEHPIVHIEISAGERQAAARFYEDVFGWETSDIPEMDYTTFEYEQGRGGGFNPVSESNLAGTVIIYILADDIEAMLAKIEAQGGQTIQPKMEIPGVGWFALFKDPTGNQMALFKNLPRE
jgi:predicted enzyme related to lactoylglutathione lyase